MAIIENLSLKPVQIETPKGRLGPMSKIMNSDIANNFSLDMCSTVNRSIIGAYFGLGCFSYIADSTIGRYCSFASRISIGPFNHPTNWLSIHEFQYRNVDDIYRIENLQNSQDARKQSEIGLSTTIGSDVWIGDNVSILRGIRIGTGAIVGMGSVVVKDVEPYSIVVGNPARLIRYRFEESVIQALINSEWWTLDKEMLTGINFQNVESALKKISNLKSVNK